MKTIADRKIRNAVTQDPIDALIREHVEVTRNLERLRNAAQQIQSEGFSFEAFVQISKAIRFIAIEVRHHNEKEEKYLLPVLERRARGSSESIRKEHRDLWRLFNRLLGSVEDIEEGRIHATTIRELVEASIALGGLLADHIAKENEIVFPLARKVFTPDEYERFSNEMAKSGIAG